MRIPTIEWHGALDGHVKLIDQTRLPNKLVFARCTTVRDMWKAIRELKVRGAPAIGIAAAMGAVLGVRRSRAANFRDFFRCLKSTTDYLRTARPTAVNLFWALDRIECTAQMHSHRPVPEIKRLLLEEAKKILEEDLSTCRAIGVHGARLIQDGAGILTHCNAGGLATAGYGTALAVLYAAHEQGKRIYVFADETRPLLQGARLTTWELMRAGIPVTLICDNMAAQVMKEGKVQGVIVGADRIAANGDVANKIGTYGLALLARAHRIPFYVAAPSSTFDLALSDGSQIPIEERSPREVTEGFGRRIAPRGVKVYSPAFDVTPASCITAIITEHGIIHRPSIAKIQKHFAIHHFPRPPFP